MHKKVYEMHAGEYINKIMFLLHSSILLGGDLTNSNIIFVFNSLIFCMLMQNYIR